MVGAHPHIRAQHKATKHRRLVSEGAAMNITRRNFSALAALTPAALLAACGGQAAPSAPAKSLTPYWVTQKVVENGQEANFKELGLDMEIADYLVLALNEDGTGSSSSMGDEPRQFTWTEKDGTITINDPDDPLTLKREGETLVLTIAEGDYKLVVTLKNVPDMPAALRGNYDVLANFKPSFDIAQTTAMSSYMLGQFFAITSDKIYGRFFDPATNKACLGVQDFTLSNGNIHVENLKILDPNTVCRHVTVVGDTVYYLRLDAESNATSIRRVKADGSAAAEVLYDGACDYLTVANDALYCTIEGGKYARLSLDGKVDKVLIDKEIYYPYRVDDDFIIYQDDADSEQLHVYSVSAQADATLTKGRSMSPVIDGSVLWYTHDASEGASPSGEFHLCRMDLSSFDATKKEFAHEESPKLFSPNISLDAQVIRLSEYKQGEVASDVRERWNQIELKDFSPSAPYTQEMYVSDQYQINEDFNADGVVTGVYCFVIGSAIGFSI